MCKIIDCELMHSLVGHANENGMIEYKCRIRCPACPKIILANHKVYAVGSRKRKNKQQSIVSSRKPVWYFTNLQSHLIKNHFESRFEVVVMDNRFEQYAHDEQNIHSDTPAYQVEPEDYSSNIERKTNNFVNFSENATFAEDADNIIDYDPSYETDRSNSSTNTNIPQTTKKRIVHMFYERLRVNEANRSCPSGSGSQNRNEYE